MQAKGSDWRPFTVRWRRAIRYAHYRGPRAKIRFHGPKLEKLVGDARDWDTIQGAVVGVEAVIQTLAYRRRLRLGSVNDFLKATPMTPYDWVITNPPFRLAEAI